MGEKLRLTWICDHVIVASDDATTIYAIARGRVETAGVKFAGVIEVTGSVAGEYLWIHLKKQMRESCMYLSLKLPHEEQINIII